MKGRVKNRHMGKFREFSARHMDSQGIRRSMYGGDVIASRYRRLGSIVQQDALVEFLSSINDTMTDGIHPEIRQVSQHFIQGRGMTGMRNRY